MGADHNVDLSRNQRVLEPSPLGAEGLIGEQCDPQGPLGQQRIGRGHDQIAQQGADSQVVLGGQHLGGGHQRALMASLHRREHCRHRNHGLARPHIALQEAVHGHRAGHVGGHLADHPALGPGQGKPQRAGEPLDKLPAGVVADSERGPFHGPLAHDQLELEPKQLIEHQPIPSGVLGIHGLWAVDAVDGLVASDQVVMPPQWLGDRVADTPLR